MKASYALVALCLIASSCERSFESPTTPTASESAHSRTRVRPVQPPWPVSPACANPAPLDGYGYESAEGFIVTIRADADFDAAMSRLGQGITVVERWDNLHMFYALLSPQHVAIMRCDAAVERVSYNLIGHGAGAPPRV